MKLQVTLDRHTQGSRKGLLSARVLQDGRRGADLISNKSISAIETAKARSRDCLTAQFPGRDLEIEFVGVGLKQS